MQPWAQVQAASVGSDFGKRLNSRGETLSFFGPFPPTVKAAVGNFCRFGSVDRNVEEEEEEEESQRVCLVSEVM